MVRDHVKEYLVCVNGGSGVVYQPSNEEFSYILTCKHVFDDIEKYDNLIQLTYYDKATSSFKAINGFPKRLEENFFPHLNKDVAILKVGRLPICGNLLRIDNYEKYNKKASLFGFPEVRRRDKIVIDISCIREDPDITFLTARANGLREALLNGNTAYEELIGQSGGGIFCFDNECIGLLGIQIRVPSRNEVLGRIEFGPLMLFDEITGGNLQDLEPIYPYYLKNFKFLLDEIFRISPDMHSAELEKVATNLLLLKAKQVAQSDVTPIFIKEYFKNDELIFSGQQPDILNKRKIWAMWMEILTILNIAKDKTISQVDFSEWATKLRLFYSDKSGDFWLNHLPDLINTDYSGLEKDALVVVASNQLPLKDHELNTKFIPNIARYRSDYETYALEMNIDSADSFPLERFRFKNISAFKEVPIVHHYQEYDAQSSVNLLKQLKILYERLLHE